MSTEVETSLDLNFPFAQPPAFPCMSRLPVRFILDYAELS
jgi:hypothetical protein